MKKKLKISQSLIKDIADYEKKEVCGKVITHKFIEGKFMPATDVMNHGHFFEYLATGAMPKSGDRPEPVYLKTKKRVWTKYELAEYYGTRKMPGQIKTPPIGLPTYEDMLSKDDEIELELVFEIHKKEALAMSYESHYQRAYRQAENFKRLCEKMGIEILKVQETKEHKGLVASRDLQIKWEGRKYTVDLKYSGLLHDEWSPMGWGGLANFNSEHTGHLKQMAYHKIQAVQYQYVFGDPFIYWVFSSSTGAEESGENMMFQLTASEFEVDQHLILAQDTADKFNFLNNLGWANYPEYNQCQGCLLKDTCEDFLDVPKPIELQII